MNAPLLHYILSLLDLLRVDVCELFELVGPLYAEVKKNKLCMHKLISNISHELNMQHCLTALVAMICISNSGLSTHFGGGFPWIFIDI